MRSSATNIGDNRNLRFTGHFTLKAASESNVLIPDENVDVLANFSLLRCDAISNTRIERPQCRQCVCQSRGGTFYIDFTLPVCKRAQRSWNVKGNWHDHLFVRADLLVVYVFTRPEISAEDGFTNFVAEYEEASSTTACRTQTTGGRPSYILSQVFPSSIEP